ncbi:MAG: CDP-glycerol glycerophosphotransferase family protein [Nocardioidaceae bacterium]
MKILFSGYAPVHFLCFRPLYDALRNWPDVQVDLSGGSRSKSPYAPGGYLFDHETMYSHFDLPEDAVRPVGSLAKADYDVMFAANTRRIEPRSVRERVQIFHGMSFRNRAIRPETDGADHYFLFGPYMKRGFEAAGIIGADDPRGVDIGFPKTDRLLDGSLDRSELLALHGITGERPVVLYAPTGERHNSMETMGEDLIAKLASVDQYDVLVKPHDHPHSSIDWWERLAPMEKEHIRLVREPDVIHTLAIADLLITDASSVANEYTLLDRPIVFIDVPELLELTFKKGAMLDLETWGRKGGEVVADVSEAVQSVEAGLANPGERSEVRQAIVADLFFNPGSATAAALRWISDDLVLT